MSWASKQVYRSMIPPSPEQAQNGRRRPTLWAVIGYGCAVLVVLYCALFVILFGLRFGSEVANAFLLSFVSSLLIGAAFVQPAIILFLSWIKYSVFMSFLGYVRLVAAAVALHTARASPLAHPAVARCRSCLASRRTTTTTLSAWC